MTPFSLLIVFILSLVEINSQYTPPYDRDRQDRQERPDRPDQNFDRNYDRQNPPYGQQYDRQGTPYGQPGQPPYDRQGQQYGQYDRQYNQSQYGRQNQYGNQSQYGNQGPPYNRDQYNRDQNNRDRDQYNRDQYNRDQQYNNRDRDQFNRDQYNRDQQNNRDQQYGSNRDRDQQYPGNRDQQYDSNRGQQYGGNRDQYSTGNRDNQYSGGSDHDRNQWGSPISDPNDNCCQDYCYSEDEQPYVQFATKTAYDFVYGKTSTQHIVPDCTPIQFWSINRHGTRYPSARSIGRLRQLMKLHSEIVRNYDERRSYPDRGRLCPKDLDLFRRWRWNETVNENEANGLTSQGITDLKFLARRYVTRFGDLFNQPYSDNTFNFQYTNTDRTHDSYQAYIEGLFRDKAYQVHANVYNEDRLIKPTKSCNAWQREVDDNPETLMEYMRFKNKQEYQQMVRDVFRRLGFRYTLNDTVIDDMYDMCRFEKAWYLNRQSPWCIVFNKEQLKILEYAEDLKYYYKSGYGNEINKKVGCPPLKDLYEKFERMVNGDQSGNKVTVFFTHSVTLQTFLTAMGIAKDYDRLTADNYFQQQRRQWKTSTIDPFASNLAAVLYQCRSGERHRVMFLLNEVPVNYPECSVGLCNWSTIKSKLEDAALNCNLDFCDQNAANALHHNYIIYFLSFVAILFSISH